LDDSPNEQQRYKIQG